jgi:S1-C subfamily serine protease
LDDSEVIVDGSDPMHEGVILDGEYAYGEQAYGEHVYHDDGPMMYDAEGFEESYGLYNDCDSCGGGGCGSCGAGNPFGFDHTLTTGIIIGLGREIKSVTERPIQGVIQTDAAINPGNSGGPLLDSAGRLIGMNTAIISPSGAYSGIGFAVPVDTINRIVPQLLKGGRVKKPGLGIRVLESEMARLQGQVGAIVANVLPNSPAAKAGLEPIHRTPDGSIEIGDIITGIDGRPVEDGNDLLRVLDEKEPGDSVSLTLNRRGETRTITVQLAGW